jgi:predicted small lipoprotein YifL
MRPLRALLLLSALTVAACGIKGDPRPPEPPPAATPQPQDAGK